MTESDALDDPIPFGIRLDTGRPFDGLSDAAISAMAGHKPEPTADTLALESRSAACLRSMDSK